MDGIPLTPEQKTGVAQIYDDVSKQMPAAPAEGSDPSIPEMLKQQAERESAILGSAAAILTPEQLAVLKSSIEWSNERARFYAESRR